MGTAPHILIVDDHREIRDLVSRALTKEGFRISAAADSKEMRKVLTDSRIDLHSMVIGLSAVVNNKVGPAPSQLTRHADDGRHADAARDEHMPTRVLSQREVADVSWAPHDEGQHVPRLRLSRKLDQSCPGDPPAQGCLKR